MQLITLSDAARALVAAGYNAVSLRAIEEGANHFVFDAALSDGRSVIAKFARTRAAESGLQPENTDTLFGGPLSLERESSLFALALGAGLPAPEVFGIHEDEDGRRFIVLQKMPGISHARYLKRSGYTMTAFLGSIRALAKDFAKLHSAMTFPSFGDILDKANIHPKGLINFADRFMDVCDMRLERGERKGAFTSAERQRVREGLKSRFDALRAELTLCAAPAVMVFTDMHGGNFFVDDAGVPSGYFDLESSQAAPAALEFYGFRFFLFNSFDEEAFKRANDAFFETYNAAGGLYTPKNFALTDLLAACRLMELAQSYWGHVDGIRDTWGACMKELLLRYLESGAVDYIKVGALFRMRDGQPNRAIS